MPNIKTAIGPSRLRDTPLNALPPDEQAVAQAFVDARLLTTDNEDHEATVGVTHEALLRQWAPLRDAIENSRASLRLRSELEREAADWEHGSRDEAYLLRGGRLATFEEWATSHGDELTSLEREFLQASRALTSKELEVARRSNRRLRQLIGGLAAFLVIVIVLGLMAWQQRRVALDQQQLATSRYLATQAETRLDSNPRLSMLLTIQAAKIKNTDEARSSLLSQMAHRQGFRGFLSAHDGVATFQDGVTSVAFSNDGQMLAAGSIDGSVALWDVPNNTQLATLTGQTGPVMDVALSSDGQTLASATPGGVGLWDVRRRSLLATLIGHKGEVHGVAFSPDGQKMASSSDDETVVLWDVARRSRLATLTDHTESVWGVAFSPDGSLLASGSDDKTVMLWDVASKKRLTSLTGHQTVVYRVAFSPDGQALASGSGDGTVNLWDLGDRIATLASHSDQVMGLAFSPDGRTLASGSLDGTVGLWDASQVALISPDGGVPSVAFRPDGRVLAAGSGDGPVGLWDVSRRTRLATLIGHRDEAGAVAFSPDGRMLASGSADDTIGLWDVASRSRLAILTVPSGVAPSTSYISHLAFSHDGRLLASANWNGTIGLWNVSTRSRLATLTSTNVNRVAFSPDGRVLAQCHVA